MHRRALIFAVSAAFVLASCGSAATSAGGGGPIKIGVLAPTSGSQADPGTDVVNSVVLAAEQLNHAGGVNGRQIQLFTEDDACDAQTAVQAAQKLVNEGVVAVTGGWCSSASIPESTILHRNGDIPYVNAESSNPTLTSQGYDDIYRLAIRDDYLGPGTASYLYNGKHYTKIAILDDNTTYAVGLAQQTKDAFEKLGGTVVSVDSITPGEKDYTSALVKAGSSSPQALLYTGYYPEFAAMVNEYVRVKPNYALVGGQSTIDNQFLTIAGAAAEQARVTVVTGPLINFLPASSTKDFTAAYQKRFNGRQPGATGVWAYDGLNLIAQAIRNDGGSTKAADLNKALHAIHFKGVTGQVSFDNAGDMPLSAFPLASLKVASGQYVVELLQENGKWKATT